MLKTFQKLKKAAASNSRLKHLTDAELNALQGVLLEMLTDLDALCRRNGLCYLLTGGSALGAVRNKGFIPWDDDVDILMPRADYEKLAACVEKELSHKYWVQSLASGEKYDLNFLKFRKKGTLFVEIYDNEPENAGICIDVFPLDDTYDNPIASKLYGVVNEGLFLMASCVRMHQKKERLLQYTESPSLARSIRLKCAIGRLLNSRRNPQLWYRRCERWSKKILNPTSRYLAVSAGRGHYFGEHYLRSDLYPTKETPFEGHLFQIAQNPHAFLKTLYGEGYRQEHKEYERESHGLIRFSLSTEESVPDTLKKRNEETGNE